MFEERFNNFPHAKSARTIQYSSVGTLTNNNRETYFNLISHLCLCLQFGKYEAGKFITYKINMYNNCDIFFYFFIFIGLNWMQYELWVTYWCANSIIWGIWIIGRYILKRKEWEMPSTTGDLRTKIYLKEAAERNRNGLIYIVWRFMLPDMKWKEYFRFNAMVFLWILITENGIGQILCSRWKYMFVR